MNLVEQNPADYVDARFGIFVHFAPCYDPVCHELVHEQQSETATREATTRVGDWGWVSHKGRDWFVSGANPPMPGVIERRKARDGSVEAIAKYTRTAGGAVVDLASHGAETGIAPALDGRIISAVHADTGKELLAATVPEPGDADLLGAAGDRVWVPDPDGDEPNVNRFADEWRNLWHAFDNAHDDRLRPPGYKGVDAMDESWEASSTVSDAEEKAFEVEELRAS